MCSNGTGSVYVRLCKQPKPQLLHKYNNHNNVILYTHGGFSRYKPHVLRGYYPVNLLNYIMEIDAIDSLGVHNIMHNVCTNICQEGVVVRDYYIAVYLLWSHAISWNSR